MAHLIKQGSNIFKVGNNIFRSKGILSYFLTEFPSTGIVTPQILCYDYDKSRIYIGGSNAFNVLDSNTGALIVSVAIASSGILTGMALDAVAKRLYVGAGTTVRVYDTDTLILLQTSGAVSSGSQSIALSVPKNRLYVNSNGGGSVVVLNATTLAVVSTIVMAAPAGDWRAVAVDSDTDRLFSSAANAACRVYNTETGAYITSFGIACVGVYVDKPNDLLYLSSTNTIAVYNLSSYALLYSIPVSGFPNFNGYAMVKDTRQNLLLQVDRGNATVLQINQIYS